MNMNDVRQVVQKRMWVLSMKVFNMSSKRQKGEEQHNCVLRQYYTAVAVVEQRLMGFKIPKCMNRD